MAEIVRSASDTWAAVSPKMPPVTQELRNPLRMLTGPPATLMEMPVAEPPTPWSVNPLRSRVTFAAAMRMPDFPETPVRLAVR